jgi:hypothetical protein
MNQAPTEESSPREMGSVPIFTMMNQAPTEESSPREMGTIPREGGMGTGPIFTYRRIIPLKNIFSFF